MFNCDSKGIGELREPILSHEGYKFYGRASFLGFISVFSYSMMNLNFHHSHGPGRALYLSAFTLTGASAAFFNLGSIITDPTLEDGNPNPAPVVDSLIYEDSV